MAFVKAIKENVPLVIGLAGGTGSGKTYSALKIAEGLAGGQKFAFIDTERRRGLFYAEEFDYDYDELEAPFTPARYIAKIKEADKAGYPVIVLDSTSHIWAGDGGVLDMQTEKLEQLTKGDWKKNAQFLMLSWVDPKGEHKKFVTAALGCKAHLILCFRAEEKIEMVKVGNKTEVRPKQSLTSIDGWIPICEKNLPFELTFSFLLLASQPGVPKPINDRSRHLKLLDHSKQIDTSWGEKLSAWANSGGKKPAPKKRKKAAAKKSEEEVSLDDYDAEKKKTAERGGGTCISEKQRRLLIAAAKTRLEAIGHPKADKPKELVKAFVGKSTTMIYEHEFDELLRRVENYQWGGPEE